jgi:type IV secretion system protein VirD4
MWASQEFAMLSAPTRSGKDVGFVIPNLLTYTDSVVCLDLKLEAWRLTAGFRAQHGQECYLFAPNHPDQTSHRWNPLSYIRDTFDYRIGDIQNLANMWYPTGGKDAFWHDNAQTLFLGLVLFIMETPGQDRTMANVLRLTTPSNGEGLERWVESTIQQRIQAGTPLSPECVDALRSFSANTETVRASILSTMVAPLKIFRNPLLAAATAETDFDFRNLRRRRMSVYVGMTAEDLTNYTLLINTFFSQLINENTKALPQSDSSLKYQCLLILNEFASLGRVRIIQKAIGFMAAYNMRLLLIFQNKGQISGNEEGYGAEGANTLISNCALKIMYQPKENEDAREYSEALGYQTVKDKSRTRQYSGHSSRSESESDQRRALMLPQELKEIGFERQIISVENCKPVFSDKIIYWRDPAFEGRISLPTPSVPRLQGEETSVTTRPMRDDELGDIAAADIVNRAEILRAIGDAIGFNFDALRITPAGTS